jgi:hypothetical protein
MEVFVACQPTLPNGNTPESGSKAIIGLAFDRRTTRFARARVRSPSPFAHVIALQHFASSIAAKRPDIALTLERTAT